MVVKMSKTFHCSFCRETNKSLIILAGPPCKNKNCNEVCCICHNCVSTSFNILIKKEDIYFDMIKVEKENEN